MNYLCPVPECSIPIYLISLLGVTRLDPKDQEERKVMGKFCFFMDGVLVPSITKKSVTNLDKVFDYSLKDTSAVQTTVKKLENWLSTVDKSGLPSRFKTWLYQHFALYPLVTSGV